MDRFALTLAPPATVRLQRAAALTAELIDLVADARARLDALERAEDGAADAGATLARLTAAAPTPRAARRSGLRSGELRDAFSAAQRVATRRPRVSPLFPAGPGPAGTSNY